MHIKYVISFCKTACRCVVIIQITNPISNFRYSHSMKHINDKYMHLTNYSIQKKNNEYESNQDDAVCQGHKWWVNAAAALKVEEISDCLQYFPEGHASLAFQMEHSKFDVHWLVVTVVRSLVLCLKTLKSMLWLLIVYRSLKALWGYLLKRGVNSNEIWKNIKDLIVKTIISAESAINSMIKSNVRNRYSVHELFGFDILLDETYKPWVLEVNISPR